MGPVRHKRRLLIAGVLALACAASSAPGAVSSGESPAGKHAAGAAKKCKKKKGNRSGKVRCRKAAKPAPPATLSPASAPIEPELSLSSNPSLFPSFDPSVSDYVVRCAGAPISVSGDTGEGTWVLVDGQGPLVDNFDQQIGIASNQALTVAAFRGYRSREYHIRCLPPDFPQWNFDLLEQPNQSFYVVSPRKVAGGSGSYVVVFDDHGVPIWWYSTPGTLVDPKVLSDGSIAWARADGTGYEIRKLDGSITRTVSFVDDYTDGHDLQEVGNGNFLVMSYKTRATLGDLSFCGGAPDQTVKDSEIQEIDPAGNVVWSWNSGDLGQIGVDEIVPRWCPNVIDDGDLVHMNSIEPSGDSVVTSLRFANAVYSINRATGAIEWKLGGTTTPESLTVLGDPMGADPVVGQHDARVLPDGTVTVHDNGNTIPARQPRAVRYEIDELARTATLIESVTDPEVLTGGCCGGARRSTSGSWLMSWGQRSQVTEFDRDGDRAFRLRFGAVVGGPISYRAFPVPLGSLDNSALRAGMDSMFPRP